MRLRPLQPGRDLLRRAFRQDFPVRRRLHQRVHDPDVVRSQRGVLHHVRHHLRLRRVRGIPGHRQHRRGVLSGQFAALQRRKQHRQRIAATRALQGKDQMLRTLVQLDLPCRHRRHPELRLLPAKLLQREIQALIHRQVQNAQCEVHRRRFFDLRRHGQRPQTHLRILVRHGLFQHLQRVRQLLPAMRQNAQRRRADPCIFLLPQLPPDRCRERIHALARPRGLQQGVRVRRLRHIQLRRPRIQLRQHLRTALIPQFALRKGAHVFAIAFQHLQQLRHRRSGDLRTRTRRAALRRHAPDATVHMVATRITEIHLAVLDDRVVPVRDVDRAVRAHLHIDRAEGAVRARQQVRQLFRDVAAPARRQRKAVHAIPAEVIQHKRPLPLRRPVRVLHDVQTALLRLTGAQAVHDALRARRRRKHAAREDEIDALAPRAIAGKALAPAIEFKTPRIDQALADHLRAARLRAEFPHAAAHQPPHAIRRLHVAVDVDRLQKVQHSLRSPAHRVQQVVRVLRAEAAQQDRALVRLQIPVRILQKEHLRRVRHIQTAITRRQRRRDVQPVREGRRFVCLAIAIRVLQHHHEVLGLLARLDVRIRRARHHPQPALRVPVHLHRLLDHRLRGKQVHLQPLRHHKRLQLRLRVRIRQIRDRGRLGGLSQSACKKREKGETSLHGKRGPQITPASLLFGKHSLRENSPFRTKQAAIRSLSDKSTG